MYFWKRNDKVISTVVKDKMVSQMTEINKYLLNPMACQSLCREMSNIQGRNNSSGNAPSHPSLGAYGTPGTILNTRITASSPCTVAMWQTPVFPPFKYEGQGGYRRWPQGHPSGGRKVRGPGEQLWWYKDALGKTPGRVRTAVSWGFISWLHLSEPLIPHL